LAKHLFFFYFFFWKSDKVLFQTWIDILAGKRIRMEYLRQSIDAFNKFFAMLHALRQ